MESRLPFTSNMQLLSFTVSLPVLILLSSFLFLLGACSRTDQYQVYEAENTELIKEASVVSDNEASGGYSVGLTQQKQAIRFTNLQASGKLAIRYATKNTGTISVSVKNSPTKKVNIHSSGAYTGSYLYAVIDLQISEGEEVVIGLDNNDVPLNIDQVIVGKGNLNLPVDIWNLPPLPIADGPFAADWKELSRIYTVPEWWRDAKFGAWSHWDPQSMPEMGDWYARGMYMENTQQYKFHAEKFGHPSEYGYKEICNNWVIDRWNPEELMDLYQEMGARYFMAMGNHHDNFDCWDSEYQPWNSVKVGPKVDIVGTWERVARQRKMPFGIGFHNTPPRTWGQFMTVRYTADKEGGLKGVPYDALQTIADGKGEWWEGLDPADLYGPVHGLEDPLLSPFANQFMWRVDDAINKYHPDIIYFDDHAGDSQTDLGVKMGLGFLTPQLIANYYNKSLAWKQEKTDVVVNFKGVGGVYNSFENTPQLLPLVDKSLVKSTEFIIESEIMAYPFQTETSLSEWHYLEGAQYMSASTVIQLLMENVSRNGSMLLNITQHGRGDLDEEAIRICKDVGAWLKVNGEAVYGSRPFETWGDDSVYYTRNQGYVYATMINWKDAPIRFKALGSGGSTVGEISKVELLGSDLEMDFTQDREGLMIMPGGKAATLSAVNENLLANKIKVLRITHNKGWINDDDPGVSAPGWFRCCNLGANDFNNDLTVSETVGDVWSYSFTGNQIAVIAPKEPGAGKIEIQIDEQIFATIDLSTNGMRQAQQIVFEKNDLPSGEHTIKIINKGSGRVAVDALVVR